MNYARLSPRILTKSGYLGTNRQSIFKQRSLRSCLRQHHSQVFPPNQCRRAAITCLSSFLTPKETRPVLVRATLLILGTVKSRDLFPARVESGAAQDRAGETRFLFSNHWTTLISFLRCVFSLGLASVLPRPSLGEITTYPFEELWVYADSLPSDAH